MYDEWCGEAKYVRECAQKERAEELRTCPRCRRPKHPEDQYCLDCIIELAVYGEEDGSDA